MTFGGTLPIWDDVPGPRQEPGRREAIAQAKKKPITSDDFYLGPIPFNTQFPGYREPSAKWLTNHWPEKRKRIRAAILAEVVGGASA